MTAVSPIDALFDFAVGRWWPVSASVFIFAWFLMLVAGKGMIARLKGLKGMKWSPREDTPDSHLAKAGTPSMGGIGIIASAVLAYGAVGVFYSVLLWFSPTTGTTPLTILEVVIKGMFFPMIVVLHALLGFIDDWSKARGKGGLRARDKLIGQILLSVGFVAGAWILRTPPYGIGRTIAPWTFAPLADFAASPVVAFGILGVLVLVLIGTSNAVNLTDGIDGLASGLSVLTGLAIALLIGRPWGTIGAHEEVALMWLALAGSCLGFLAFNKHKAKVFMGDTGSLALGAALGAAAILTRSVLLLPFIGFMFYIEMFSVMSQVAYFKYTKKKTGEGKRIFRRAPLHHHFELGGWSEWRVVVTFWAVHLAVTAIGLILWSKGIIPRFP